MLSFVHLSDYIIGPHGDSILVHWESHDGRRQVAHTNNLIAIRGKHHEKVMSESRNVFQLTRRRYSARHNGDGYRTNARARKTRDTRVASNMRSARTPCTTYHR